MLLEESRYIEQYLEARWALYYGYISNAHITSQSHAFFLKENDLNHIAHPFTFLLLTPVIYLHYIQVFFFGSNDIHVLSHSNDWHDKKTLMYIKNDRSSKKGFLHFSVFLSLIIDKDTVYKLWQHWQDLIQFIHPKENK